VGFFLFILLNAVLFIRPAEIVPALMDLPIYEALIVLCFVASLPDLIRMLTQERWAKMPIFVGVLGIWVAIVLSQVFNSRLSEARTEAILFSKIVLYYVLLITNVSSKERLGRFVASLAVFTFVMTSLSLLQYHEWVNIPALAAYRERQDDVIDPATGEPAYLLRLVGAGIFNDPNDLCLILCLGAFFCVYLARERSSGLRRYAWLMPVPLFGYALSLTHSRGGFLAMLAGLLTMFANRYGMRKTALMSALVLPVLFLAFAGRQTSISTSEGTGQQRIQLWSEGLSMLGGKALAFGIGKGMVVEELGYVSHNSYVQSYVELGLVGGTIFLGMFVYSVRALAYVRTSCPSLDTDLRRFQPYLLAVVVSFAVGYMSLSRGYSLTTYLVFGLVTAFMRLSDPRPAAPWLKLGPALLAQLASVSLVFIAAIYLFIRLSLRWGSE
jgi:putative inorganic carbon (HCO3(-)) transporter